MGFAYIKEDDEIFLLRASRFCRAIDPFMDLLGLDRMEVELFKNEMVTLLYITQNYRSFSTSFILYNIGAMRQRMIVLAQACLKSINYTKNIGKVLGIQEPSQFNDIAFRELDFYKSFRN